MRIVVLSAATGVVQIIEVTDEIEGIRIRGWDVAELVGDFIAARLPARRAVIQTIAAQANVDLSLAGAAILLAIALVFGHVALHAAILGLSDGCHAPTVAPVCEGGKFRW